jgi:hypothetical protein
MTIASNLYAEKVFAEQPLALWALDDTANFINLLPASATNPSNWIKTNVPAFTIDTTLDSSYPISSSYAISATAATPTGSTQTATISYPAIANFNELDHNMGTISIAFYFSSGDLDIQNLAVGYAYTDPDTLQLETVFSNYTYTPPSVGQWGFVGATLSIPNIDATFSPFISIVYAAGSSLYNFEINGISVGQWSESFQPSSTGIYPAAIPAEVATLETLGIEAAAYGLQDKRGYYIVSDKVLYARNSGVPLVYGAPSSTRIYPKSGPSLIFPGFGFMNESGKYREATVEFWLRVDTKTQEPRRIFGPIANASLDGLYVDGSFLTLKLGKYFGSHFVGEWGRPMLINIRISEKSLSLVLNGEEVITLSINISEIDIPNKFIEIDESILDQDWLGFYGYSDISVYEIDAFGIYPYIVPAIVSKRRFVYGQGVDFPENLNTAYNGSSIFVDYSFADYTNNYNYPDMGRWDQGIVDNANTNNNILTTPSYSLPVVKFKDLSKTYDSWIAANNEENTSDPESRAFITLRPSSDPDWEDEEGYILFDRLNFIGEDVTALYGVFQPIEDSANEQTLFKIENNLNGNYFLMSIEGSTISYKLKYGVAAPQTIYSVETVVPDIPFSVGLNIDNLSAIYGGNLATFFGNKNQLKVYVGGSTNLSNTFTGKIFNIGFSTARNASKISTYFNQSGIASIPTDVSDVFMLYFDDSPDGQIDFTTVGGYIEPFTGDWISFEGTMDGGFADSFVFGRFQDHIASYTLLPQIFIGELKLEIAVDSYWEDYVPLSYFASYITDIRDNRYYDVDFLQFNISNTRQLAENSGAIVTENSVVRTYVTFQYLATGSNALYSSFANIQPVSPTHVITPGTSWMNTKYEVVSGDIIYMPPGADINDLSIGVHIEIQHNSTISKPLRITSLQLASQALDYALPNPIGTRFGYEMVPYSRSGIYFNYKGKNPYSIYKGSNPYLYMSKYSGIKLCGLETDRGISIRVNDGLAEEYAVGAIQMAVQYQEGLFPTTPTEIFEIQSSNLYAKFYLVAANEARTRAKIYALNVGNNTPVSGIAYYLNGNLSKDLFIERDAWSIISIQFANALIYTSEIGAIRLTGPLMFNNIAYYELPSTQTSLSIDYRRWSELSDLADYWEDLLLVGEGLWQDILYISVETSYTIDPSVIYREYTGTNRITVTSGKVLTFGSYKYSLYTDADWRSSVLLPV